MKKITFKWNYVPANYFDQKIEYEIKGWKIDIHNGCAQAVVQSDGSVINNQTLRVVIHGEIKGQFSARKLLKHSVYELDYDRVEEENAEGKRNIIIEVEAATFKLTAHPPEITITDKNGNITYDSRKEREDSEEAFHEKVVAVSRIDPLFTHLMNSYEAAVNEPENELVRLYEIRDALVKYYGGDGKGKANKAKKKLKITDKKWSRLGVLCNKYPLNQGRHKGQHIGVLRDATDTELRKAREIARELMEAHWGLILKEEECHENN